MDLTVSQKYRTLVYQICDFLDVMLPKANVVLASLSESKEQY